MSDRSGYLQEMGATLLLLGVSFRLWLLFSPKTSAESVIWALLLTGFGVTIAGILADR